MLSVRARWFVAALVGLLAFSVAFPVSGQDSTANDSTANDSTANDSTANDSTANDSTTSVELRVWQSVADPLRVYVGARAEGGSWDTLGAVRLALTGRTASGAYRYGDVDLGVPLPGAASEDSTANVEMRVWQRVADPLRVYVSARAEGGSWDTLGTVRLALTGRTASGAFRYGDVDLGVPLPAAAAQQPLPDAETLRRLERDAPAVIDLPWFSDGLTEVEAGALRSLARLAGEGAGGAAIVESVVALRWFGDGIDEAERDVLLWLARLDDWSEEAALAVVGMPFLSSVEPDDVLALRGLERLAASRDGRLDAALTHPSVRDGITDDETTLVAATGAVGGASEVRRILGRGNARVEVEVASAATERTPDLKISVIRAGTRLRQSTIREVRDAVEFVEGVMGRPLPVGHVIVVVDDAAVTAGDAGTNHGFAFGVRPGDERHETPYETFSFRSKIVAATAHFFWRGHAPWVDEGVADTIEHLYGEDAGVSPGLRKNPRRGACEAHDLETLTERDPSPDEQGRDGCDSFLGQSLFSELLEAMGREAFSQRLRELYRLTLDTKDDPEAETPGIAEVREAFADQAAVVEKHWSGALNAPENRPADEGTPGHRLVRWDQRPLFDGEFVTFRGTLLGDAVLFRETLAEARRGGRNFTLHSVADSRYVGAILPPPAPGAGDAADESYELDDGTFSVSFEFPQALGDPSDYVIVVWGYQDASRSSFFGYERDVLGDARIRTE